MNIYRMEELTQMCRGSVIGDYIFKGRNPAFESVTTRPFREGLLLRSRTHFWIFMRNCGAALNGDFFDVKGVLSPGLRQSPEAP